MSTVSELTNDMFKNVGIYRRAFPMARHYFDVHMGDDGIHAYYMWKRNDFRIPIYHHLSNFFKRMSRKGKSRDEAVAKDERSLFVSYDDIQGVVTYRDHKEIQLLSTEEQIYFLFRPFDDYDKFVEYLKENLPDRYFTRDSTEIEDTVYIS